MHTKTTEAGSSGDPVDGTATATVAPCAPDWARTAIAAVSSHQGGRAYNEDTVLAIVVGRIDGPLHLVVAVDGMGGHTGGAQAAQAALRAVAVRAALAGSSQDPVDQEALLRAALADTQEAVLRLAEENPAWSEAGAAIVVLAVCKDRACYTHLGDCRLYLHRNGVVEKLTRDDSYLQPMVDAGILTEAQAAVHPDGNLLVRCLGRGGFDTLPEVCSLEVQPGDTLLATTDGFWRAGLDVACRALDGLAHTPVTSSVLHSLLSQLVYGVVERGADDNVSAALLHVPGPGPWVRKTWPLNHKEN